MYTFHNSEEVNVKMRKYRYLANSSHQCVLTNADLQDTSMTLTDADLQDTSMTLTNADLHDTSMTLSL